MKFKGWELASVSTHDPDAVVSTPMGKFRDGSRRWRELALYRTVAGAIVATKVGRSRVPSEVNRWSCLVIQQGEQGAEEQLIEFFGRDALAKELLDQVGIEDAEELA